MPISTTANQSKDCLCGDFVGFSQVLLFSFLHRNGSFPLSWVTEMGPLSFVFSLGPRTVIRFEFSTCEQAQGFVSTNLSNMQLKQYQIT